MTFGEFKDVDFRGEIHEQYLHQAGFIAQEVKYIPELTFTVHVDDETTKHSLDYNNLFTYNIQAVKELDSKLQQQKPVIDLLKS